MGRTHAALALRRTAGKNRIVFRINGRDKVLRDSAGQRLKLRVEVGSGGICRFRFAEGNDWMAAPDPFQATAGHWIGAKVGIYALKRDSKNRASHADFKYFHFLPPRSA